MNINKIFETITKRLSAGLLALAAVAGLSSCERIFDTEGDCDPHYYVRFVYDMNMLSSDAFAAKVNSVNLWVFDAKTGQLAAEYSDKGEALGRECYRMAVDLKPGQYDFYAWCGLADNEGHFTVPAQISKPADLECLLHGGAQTYSKVELHDLFHGRVLAADLPDKQGDHLVTVYLTKDTNNINVSFHHIGEELNPDDFIVTIEDNNGHLNYDNTTYGNQTIEYRPWSIRSGEFETLAESRADDEPESEISGFLITELSTSRLMADHQSRIWLREKESGETIFSMSVVEWALKFRSAKYAKMGDQEYLDREDEYNLTVFLTGGERWTAVEIVINGWRVILDDGVTL